MSDDETADEDNTDVYRDAVSRHFGREDFPRTLQRQDSLSSQLEDLVNIANKHGMYDAADYLRNLTSTVDKN